MLEAVPGLPGNVIGIVVKGRVTNSECRSVLRPLITAALKRHKSLRLYYELNSRYPGAGWDELHLGLKPPAWERAAVVSDTAWVRQMANAFLFLVAKDVQVFKASEAEEAKAWISAGMSLETPAENSSVLPFRGPGQEIELPPRPGQPARRGTHLYKRPSPGR